jgi:hypothetical protein
MHRHIGIAVLAAVVTALLLPAVAAGQGRAAAPERATQPAAPRPAPAPVVYESQPSYQTVNELQQLLQRYPPTVRQVLQLDSSLLDEPGYLQPYPALAAFVQQHPEIRRNPSFFLGEPERRRDDRDPKIKALDMMEGVLGGGALFTGIMVALLVVASLVRQLIEYRRWLRQSRIQTEANTKVIDRLTSNEDLLAYANTPAGISFLQAAPAAFEPPRTGGAPMGRILWSIQAGIVLAALGVGLWLVKGSVMEEVAPGFIVFGTVAVAVGIGFILSAGIAYVLTFRVAAFESRC